MLSVKHGQTRQTTATASAALGIGLTESSGAFIELLADMPQHGPWQPAAHLGFTYLITPVLQADLYAGKGLYRKSADIIIGGGFSYRFAL